ENADVRRGVAPNSGEHAILDAVAAHGDAAGAEYIDGVAVLPGAAVARANLLDGVVEHQRAVFAGLAAPDLDAVVAGAAHVVARDDEAAGVQRENCGVGCTDERATGDFTADAVEMEAEAAGADEFAIRHAYALAIGEGDEADSFRQRLASAVESHTVDLDVASARRGEDRSGTVGDKAGRAGHAGDLDPRRQGQACDAISAGPERERRAHADGLI